MALSVAKTISILMLRSARGTVSSVNAAPTIHRSFTRSLWHMCRPRPAATTTGTRSSPASLRCSCCGLHTEGDKIIADFLEEEIKLEQESSHYSPEMPVVNGFDVSIKGTDVTMTKSSGNETVTVKFNVNNSVDDESPYEIDGAGADNPEYQGPKMICRPPLHIEINKGGEKRIVLQCIFPPQMPEEDQQPQEQDYEDLLEIQDMAMLGSGEEWSDTSFTVSASLIDGNLYAMLLQMLEERGINGDFVDEVVKLSTTVEHKCYLGFLGQLQKFVSSPC